MTDPQNSPALGIARARPMTRRRSTLSWIAAAVALFLVLVGGVGCSASDSSNEKSEGSSTAGLNTPVQDGKLEFVVTNVQSGVTEVGGDGVLAQQPQGQFVIVSVTVKNTSNQPKSFTASDQQLKDAAGRTFESDPAAAIAVPDNDISVWGSINPGNQIPVKLVYDIPTDAVPATITLHDTMLSKGVSVSLTQ